MFGRNTPTDWRKDKVLRLLRCVFVAWGVSSGSQLWQWDIPYKWFFSLANDLYMVDLKKQATFDDTGGYKWLLGRVKIASLGDQWLWTDVETHHVSSRQKIEKQVCHVFANICAILGIFENGICPPKLIHNTELIYELISSVILRTFPQSQSHNLQWRHNVKSWSNLSGLMV